MNFIKKLLKTQDPIQTTLTITSSNGFHLRPIAQFVNEAKKFKSTITIATKQEEVLATQVPKLLSLSLEKGDMLILSCLGSDAIKASKHLSAFFEQLMQDDKALEQVEQEETEYDSSTLYGETIAKGIAIAPLINYELIQDSQETDSNLSLEEAIIATKLELSELSNTHNDGEESQIFLAQKELLSADIFENLDGINIFKTIIEQEISKLQGGAFETRIPDYRDIEQRVLSHLGIVLKLKLPSTPYILIAQDLLPSEISKLEETPIQGVILQKGSPTAHASILLRSAGIPSVIITEKVSLSTGAILDANSGNLILYPNDKDRKKAQNKLMAFKEEQKESFKNRLEPTHTKQGKVIKILANISDVNSAKEAREYGADGIGLLRTEFLFQTQKPTLEEQTEAYLEIFQIFDDITIRTLDIGGDKSLPYINIPKEDNPFLGLRGIRFSLHEKILFKEQLLAIFQAVNRLSSNNKQIKIMFPMISEKQEFKDAKAIAIEVAKEHKLNIGQIKFGIMIEVPAVILAIKLFDNVVDFYSIGTNDLTQYLFAIERTHDTLKVDPLSPILMSALKIIMDTTHKPISICGELAGLDEATEQLLGMGYENLSVSAKLIPSLKERIRHV